MGKKNAHVLSRLLNLYKLIKILAISEFDKGNLFMFSIKMLPKDQVFFNFNLDVDGEIGGNLSMIGTTTLNSLGLKEKANLMPRGGK